MHIQTTSLHRTNGVNVVTEKNQIFVINMTLSLFHQVKFKCVIYTQRQ